MAKVTFITLYDQYSPGLRIMSGCLREGGHVANTIYFKRAYSRAIETPHPDPVSGEVFKDFELREYARSDEPWSEREVVILLKRLREEDPDIIGISNRSPLDRQCLPLLERIKTTCPQAVLVAGGWGPLLAPELYLQQVDFVVFGEGEEAIVALAGGVDAKADLNQIDNLIYIEDGHIIRNPVREPSQDLDCYPLPDFDNPGNCLIEDDRLYDEDPANRFDPNVDTYSLLVGRGCVRGCSYCSEGQWKKLYLEFSGHHISPHRVRSPAHILAECRKAKDRGHRYISILESHLTGSQSFLLEFFERYQKEISLPFTAYLHPQQIARHPEILDAACRAGFKKGPIGVQHGSEAFCREYFNRHIPNALICQVSEMFREKGVQIEYQFIAGIPFETEETLADSLNFVKILKARSCELTVSRLKIFPRSPLEELIREKHLPSTGHPVSWYFAALLYNFRTFFDDAVFSDVFQLTTGVMKHRDKTVAELLPDYYRRVRLVLDDNQVTSDYPQPLLEQLGRCN